MSGKLTFEGYQTEGFHDELFNNRGQPRPGAQVLVDFIDSLPEGKLRERQGAIERALHRMGITFAVYGDESGTEKIFPFDIVPRIVEAFEWNHIAAGLKQRIRALNLFIDDIYNEQDVLKDQIIPIELVTAAASFRRQCIGLRPPKGVWCHITGTDLIRHKDGAVYVLEDNLRCPSGVSYVLQNRLLMKRSFPLAFAESNVRPVFDYPIKLYETLVQLAPEHVNNPQVVVLTPGIYNSAYYEHSFLAQQMGVELVEGRDLVVKDGFVYMRTTDGFQRVDVIYRRIDDDFIDPTAFRKDSMLGVPGLMNAYRSGRVALANAPGTGIADDKVIYAYVPDFIRYYLDEEPILPNVPTYICAREEDRKYVLANLDKLVVKAANEAGGYGMLVGPHATPEERAEFAHKVQEDPRNYIAQPTLSLSRVPTLVDDHFEGRHVDLRPYILYGKDVWVLPGGLTRVALRKGSLVVNSSQGGGSKDTWVLADVPEQVVDSEAERPI
ncbi:MAG: circularly permuted type 2 ATP-grasp protein [bacterium]|nr:circularly permuted type 2 ATP-grasp protein [bacterium]